MDRLDTSKKLQELIENIPGGIGICDVYPDDTLDMVYMNDGYYEMIGATRQERASYERKGVIQAVPVAERENLIANVKQAIHGDGTFVVTLSNQGKKDHSKWMQLKGKLVERTEEKSVFYITYTDVSYYQKIYEDLERTHGILIEKERKQQADDRKVIERAVITEMEFIALLDLKDETIRLISARNGEKNIPSIEPELFLTYKKMAGKKFILKDDLIDFEKDYTIQNMKDIIEREGKFVLTYRLIGEDSVVRRKKVRAFFLDDNKDKIVLGRRDITDLYNEEIRQEKKLKDALENAENANRSKTEFFARMSHDMRTPMNGILGLANLSKEETDIAVLKENMNKISGAGEYLLGLINDTLDLQKIESGKMVIEPQIIQVQDLLESIISMVRETAKTKGVQFSVRNVNAQMNAYVRIDPMRTKQIFINLLSNAVKFTPTGGVVEFGIEIKNRNNQISHVMTTVTDTGIGMGKEFLVNGIFKPFSQEYNKITAQLSGTGLGLSIAKQLTELMGGSISVESEKGSGTTFTVLLDFPLVEEVEVKQSNKADVEKKTYLINSLKGRRILLAEDHPLNAEITMKLLDKVGCEVTWVQNGRECVETYKEAMIGTYDLILMDIRMPVMTGLEAAEQIRGYEASLRVKNEISSEKWNGIPIIAMTANAYEDDVKASMAAGMNGHLSKPVNPQDMYEAIAEKIE